MTTSQLPPAATDGHCCTTRKSDAFGPLTMCCSAKVSAPPVFATVVVRLGMAGSAEALVPKSSVLGLANR